jgi:glutamate-5-semialdehyde dehydrogenase
LPVVRIRQIFFDKTAIMVCIVAGKPLYRFKEEQHTMEQTQERTDVQTREDCRRLCRSARKASRIFAAVPTDRKNGAILRLADLLNEYRAEIVEANLRDLERAEEKGLPRTLIERLRFGDAKIDARLGSLKKIAALPDPVGQTEDHFVQANGLRISRMRVPLGVLLMIYEARPHVTVNAAAFCIKSSNAAILKGGSEVLETNKALARVISAALEDNGLPADAVQVLSTSDRALVQELLRQSDYIDLAIPRGGEDLIRYVDEHAHVPVIKHYKGVCHCYVDGSADVGKALDVIMDSKLLMPEVCNALETLLVDRDAADGLLPQLAERAAAGGLELRGCSETRARIPVGEAVEEDWHAEYLDTILSVKVVDSIGEAISHIRRYGSAHTDTIVSDRLPSVERFVREVDSGVVLVNASTMFNDGEELGLGAEIGISTGRLHARGPMGLKELTTYKFVVYGNGHCKNT